MPLDFPASPITGATYTAPNGTIWVFDGAKWANGVYIGTAYAPINAPTFTGDARAVTPPSGDADTSVATTAFVSAAVAPAFNGVGRNLIHNPLFNVAQRGAGPFTTASAYTLDRWQMFLASDTMSISQSAVNDANRAQIGDEAAGWMLLNSNFVGNAAAGAQSCIFQNMEDVRRLANKTVVVSFYAQANAALKLGVSLDQNFGTGGSPSASVLGAGQNVTLSTNWARYSLTFTLPSIAGKTLGTAGNDRTALAFWYSSGTTNATRAGNVGVQSGTIALWGVQLEVGGGATPLEKPDPQQDLAKAQRFYQTGFWLLNTYASAASGVWQSMASLPVSMRVNPAVAVAGTPTYTNSSGASLASWDTTHFVLSVTATAIGPLLAYGTYTATADL